MESETFVFQAEINQLMSLIINAFYSNKDIFLRELIANASDAMDKFRHGLLERNGSATAEALSKLQIRLIANKDAKTLEIQDNGIGMTRQDLIENLGTIARSGTKQFMQAMADNKDLSMIGQFGVGFYSAYLVADKVTVTSKYNDTNAETYVWESNAGGSFTISVAPPDHPLRHESGGTSICLHLKEDLAEYLEESKLKEIIQKHSSFITYPIFLEVHRTREIPLSDALDEDAEIKEEVKEEDGVVEDKENENNETRTESYTEWEQLNKQKPLWMQNPNDCSTEDYNAFYKAVCGDWEDPLAVKHFSVEGQLEFRGLLFVPRRAPFDLLGREKRDNLKLYVRRVFITDDSEQLIPEWLSFVKGIVDSNDLPLNVSREMLQQTRIMKVIQKSVVKKCIEMFTDMATDPDRSADYEAFYENFSKYIKLGVYEDDRNKDKLVDLLRFHSSATSDDLTSLEDYVTRMKEGQTEIYYITGESLAQVRHSPFTEQLRKDGMEILYMIDTIDEYMMQRFQEYKDKKLVCVTKEGALSSTDNSAGAHQSLCDKIQSILADHIQKVQVSSRISDTPVVLVTSDYGWSANMERIMKAQALQSNAMTHSFMRGKKIMEINPNHALLRALAQRFEDPDQADAASTKDIVNLLYESALLHSGFSIDDPNAYVRRVHRMLQLGMCPEDDGTITDEKPGTETGTGTETNMEEVD